jgi:nucleotide-binding universal stress UspA family protein
MNVLVGVDDAVTAESLSAEVASIGLADANVTLAFVVEILGGTVFEEPNRLHSTAIQEFTKTQLELANTILLDSAKSFKGHGLSTSSKILTGLTANALVNFANEVGTDLIVVGHSGKNLLERVVVGSVSRKLILNAKQSILISKNIKKAIKPITLVLATDHSEYASRCIDKLLSWSPQNIARVIVTTVYPEQLLKTMGAILENFKADVSAWVKEGLIKKNAAIADKFRIALPTTTISSRVEAGQVSDVLDNVMKEEQADLLVVGAQGHGFVDRITLGSVSLDQVLHHSYSVLVVRD